MRLLESFAVIFLSAPIWGCGNSPVPTPEPVPAPENVLDFGVYWPPQDPADPAGPVGEPLLRGKLCLQRGDLPDTPDVQNAFTLWIELTRPGDDEHREIWNSRLAYRELDWMSRVRVWDADKMWLWPNVPYLLRAHGKHRTERYGGIDPGKGVDNDFAAVLIRAYDGTGTIQSPVTQDTPLVSAEWHPVGVKDVDRETIVHSARSDSFVLPIGNAEPPSGRFGVWLVYADFMGAPSPTTWPKKLEWAGGILAYFEIDWDLDVGGECQFHMKQTTPPADTGFDWEKWIGPTDGDETKRAAAKLSGQ